MRYGAAFALALLPALAAQAQTDCLSPVRSALRALKSTAPLKATLNRSLTSQRKDRVTESGRVNLEVQDGPEGIHLLYPATLLEQIRRERAQTDPEKPQPTVRTILGFDAIDVEALMNAAPPLLAEIDGATCKSESDSSVLGKPAHLLDLQLQVRTSKANSKWLKRADSTMKLWVGVDHVPLRAVSEFSFRAGFLVFNFDGKDVETHDYAVSTDRLVGLRYTVKFDGEGLGESQHTASETTLTLAPGS